MPTNVSGSDSFVNINLIVDNLKIIPGTKVADFGCGFAGYFTFPLSQKVGEQGLVYAVDVQMKVLKNIVKETRIRGINNVKIIWADLEIKGSTKLDNFGLDNVLIVNMLNQTNQPKLVFGEALRILKIGGKLLIVDWKNGNLAFGPTSGHTVNKETVMQLARESNMKLILDFEPGPYHYGIILEKKF